MQPTSETDYKTLFSQLIKKQMLVLGPDITLAKVKNVIGLSIDVNGEVLKMDGDPQQMLQALINQFVELSGMIVKKTMESILTSYPGMMAMASSGAFGGNAQVSTQPVVAPTVTAQTGSITPDQTEATVIPVELQPNISESKDTVESAPKEPPSITAMNLESLKVTPDNNKEPQVEPQSFSSKDMQELNQALDQLSKAPLSTENTPTAQPQVQ